MTTQTAKHTQLSGYYSAKHAQESGCFLYTNSDNLLVTVTHVVENDQILVRDNIDDLVFRGELVKLVGRIDPLSLYNFY